jgi:hypothetical protein
MNITIVLTVVLSYLEEYVSEHTYFRFTGDGPFFKHQCMNFLISPEAIAFWSF